MKRTQRIPNDLSAQSSRRITAQVVIDYLADGTITYVELQASGEPCMISVDNNVTQPATILFDRLRRAVNNEFTTNKR